jgi:hypothetical protein
MSPRYVVFLLCLGLLSACGDGQPLFDDETPVDPVNPGEGTDTDGDGEADLGVVLPPGTQSPAANDGILRYEARDGNGGGLVREVSYNSNRDTFTVDNLGFDGANVYQRGDDVSTIGRYAVYDADIVTRDFLTGNQISQIVPYRAVLGISRNQVAGEARTSFAIVRTGGYVDYGFGGFIYERNGSVVLPTTGQATFSGDYSGVRVFQGRGGLEYTTGDMTIDIDFDDFNANDAVKGVVENREAFTSGGDPIPLGGDDELVLPDLQFVVQEGAQSLDENGELRGQVANSIVNDTGALEPYETGVYYGIIAGDTTRGNGGEIVGVIVVESDDPRFDGVTAQETGGFILYR